MTKNLFSSHTKKRVVIFLFIRETFRQKGCRVSLSNLQIEAGMVFVVCICQLGATPFYATVNVTFVVFLYVICNFLKNGVKLRFTVIGRKFVVFVNSLMS